MGAKKDGSINMHDCFIDDPTRIILLAFLGMAVRRAGLERECFFLTDVSPGKDSRLFRRCRVVQDRT